MIGQFTFIDGRSVSHTASLTDNLQWASTDRALAYALNILYPAKAEDRGGGGGQPGHALLARAAKNWRAEPVIFRNEFQPAGRVF